MARSGGKRGVMEHHCLNRFRRRRLLAFLRRNSLPATFDALKHETSVFLDVRFLRRLVAGGRWQEAREYLSRFLPCQDEVDAPTALRFLTRLNVLDDLAQGKLEGIDLAQDLRNQIDVIPSTIFREDPHYAAALRTVLFWRSHPTYWGPVDWQLIRRKAAQVVKDLVARTPEFRHLLRLPPCPSHPCYTIPFGFGGCRRHKRKKNIGRMSASLLARRFLQKERRHSSPWTQGSSCEPMGFEEIIDETMLAGKLEVIEHSDSCSEGDPGSPVGLSIGKSFGTAPANAVTKRLSQECSAESSNGAKLKPTTGQFCPDVVDARSGWTVDANHVLNKIETLGDISTAMAMLVNKTCTYGGPDHTMFLEKTFEHEKMIFELRLDCQKAKTKRLNLSIGNLSTRQN
ncbi:hypothetical protein CFC21_110724 [Triticum aestivum]|uniref:CTLH domain-containing protein n=2 Tax=Triticum aestivum TaxID=4565 RepID=A0A3B6TWK9_WHEAT|nr:uncharacterized protein LOC123165935 isoform X1 [Triticum aestivum]KAF7110642.1 hypothetical protein CFC21_110724 [Triticum aestivum]